MTTGHVHDFKIKEISIDATGDSMIGPVVAIWEECSRCGERHGTPHVGVKVTHIVRVTDIAEAKGPIQGWYESRGMKVPPDAGK
jgi:hypothetical protein